MKKVLFWGYEYPDMKIAWRDQCRWIANAFKCEMGYNVLKHKDFICKGMIGDLYVPDRDRDDIDIVIYNHTDQSKIKGNVVPCRKNLFFKPTVPTPKHSTLDSLGYGPYSSITYNKPDFEDLPGMEVDQYFDTKVKGWIEGKVNKWENHHPVDEKIPFNDYYLVIGQCGGDSVVSNMDFGNYWERLQKVIRELLRVGDREIVVKLHPYTDGKKAKDTIFSDHIYEFYDSMDERVHVYKGKSNIHDFIKKAHSVFIANSGAGFEVMMHGKPIITWGFPEYHWVSYDLRHICDIGRSLDLEWFDRDLQRKFLYWYTERYCFYDQDSCNRRVRELCEVVEQKHLINS